MEVLNGEQVYACNVCNKGCDLVDEVKKHIKAFLARFDDDGNMINRPGVAGAVL